MKWKIHCRTEGFFLKLSKIINSHTKKCCTQKTGREVWRGKWVASADETLKEHFRSRTRIYWVQSNVLFPFVGPNTVLLFHIKHSEGRELCLSKMEAFAESWEIETNFIIPWRFYLNVACVVSVNWDRVFNASFTVTWHQNKQHKLQFRIQKYIHG